MSVADVAVPAAPNALVTNAIEQLASGESLTSRCASDVLAEIISGDVSETQTAAFLIALRTKGETADEIAGLAATMRAIATPVRCARLELVDTAGTGGGSATFNVSTTAALIAAGAGCAVAKHGNRSATSRSGSADLLEALGAQIELAPEAVAECIDRFGFGFMFAPVHHVAMRAVSSVRMQLGVRTIFNLLGPLTNPAGARRQLIGVSDRAYLEPIANAVAQLGCDRVLVVSGDDGIDELSVSAATRVVEINGTRVHSYDVHPSDFGLAVAGIDRVQGGAPDRNASITRSVLAGEGGAPTDLAIFNAGAAIYASGRVDTLADGVDSAREAVVSGAAQRVLQDYIRLTNELG